jgi:hypothetical protein
MLAAPHLITLGQGPPTVAYDPHPQSRRAISDHHCSESVTARHQAEAVQYRTRPQLLALKNPVVYPDPRGTEADRAVRSSQSAGLVHRTHPSTAYRGH